MTDNGNSHPTSGDLGGGASAGPIGEGFTLPDAEGNPVSLSSYRGRRVIVYCYPAALTPGCTTQAVDFTAAAGDLAEAGLDRVNVSLDTLRTDRFAEITRRDRLGDVAAPTLLLWGTGDPVFQQRYLDDLMRRAPHADVHRFEEASHLVWEDADVAGVESGRVIARPPSGRSRRPRGHARG